MSTRADILVAAPVAARRTVRSAAEPRVAVALVEVPHTVRSVAEPRMEVALVEAPRAVGSVAEPRVVTLVQALSIVTSAVRPPAVVVLEQVLRTVRLVQAPREAILVEALRTVTSVVELRAVVIQARVCRTVSLAEVPRAETQVVGVLRTTRAAAPHMATPVEALRAATRAVAVGTIISPRVIAEPELQQQLKLRPPAHGAASSHGDPLVRPAPRIPEALGHTTRRNHAAISSTSCGHTECGIV
jgi:hypothetical protein